MLNPFGILLALIRLLSALIIMVTFILVYSILSRIFFKNTQERAFKLRSIYIRIITAIFGISCDVEGKARAGTALYVSNHRSPLDPVILLHYLDAYVIAKAEVANIPFLHTGAQLTGVIYVQRESKDSRYSVREKLVEKLKEGINILVYPEGTVNYEKKIMEYRPGTFIEATKNNIPVIPVILEYYHQKDLWKNRSMTSQLFLQLGKLRTKSRMRIGEPMTAEDGIMLRDNIMEWTQSQVNKMHSDWKGSVFYDTKS